MHKTINIKLVLRILSLSILCISSIIFLYGIYNNDIFKLFDAAMLLFFHNLIVGGIRYKKGIIFFFFHCSFFLFLLGSVFMRHYKLIENEDWIWWGSFSFEAEPLMSKALVLIWTSLLFLLFGYFAYFIRQKKNSSRIYMLSTLSETMDMYAYIQRIAMPIYIISTICFILNAFPRIMLVSQSGYLSQYVHNFDRSIISVFSGFYDVSFFTLLYTRPSKRKTLILSSFYLGCSAIYLLAGGRFAFATRAVIVVWYMFFRDFENNNNFLEKYKKWVNKRSLVILLISLLLCALLFFNLSFQRSGLSASNNEILEKITHFVDQQGSSIRVVMLSEKYKDSLPPQNWEYMFGVLKEEVFRQIGIRPSLTSDEYINGRFRYHRIQSYYYLSLGWYIDGMTLGGSYIADSYHSFGIIGVIVISFIYGFLMPYFERNSHKSPIRFIIACTCIQGMIILPRDDSLGFLVNIVNVRYLSYLLLMFIALNIYKSKRKDERL